MEHSRKIAEFGREWFRRVWATRNEPVTLGDAEQMLLDIMEEHAEYTPAWTDPEWEGEGENPFIHTQAHFILERGLDGGDLPSLEIGLERLRIMGYDRHESVHLLCGPLMRAIRESVAEGRECRDADLVDPITEILSEKLALGGAAGEKRR